MKNKIGKFWDSLYNREICSKKELVREMVRIKLTEVERKKISLCKEDLPSEDLYETMKKRTEEELGYFPGDRDFFYELYDLGRDIDLQEFAIQTYKNDRMGMILAPMHLASYMANIIESNNINNVLITDAEKSLVGLVNVIKEFKNIQFTLTSENRLMFLLLSLLFKGFESVCVKHLSIYKKLVIGERFDLVLCLPAFGLKLDSDDVLNKYMTRESEGIAVENLLRVIDRTGKLFVIVPARFTFSGNGFERIRNKIISDYGLESIYTLPEGTFRPYTGIKTYMLGISNELVSETELGNLKLESDVFIRRNKKKITKEEFNKYTDWRVELLLSENQDEIQKFKKSEVPKFKLKEVAEIFRGKSVMKKDVQPGKIHVLNISNIENGHIFFDKMDTIDEEKRKIKRYELLDKDLVVTCRGTMNKVAVYKASDKFVIASANIIVIRFQKNVMSDYVKIFMESPVGSTIIKSFQRGTMVMNINPKDVGEMEVPIANIEVQKKIVEEYLNENKLYIDTIKKAESRWETHKQELFDKILK
ncbi:MAG: restriction endonuclease subunit S [Parabacteroides sp.]